MIAWNINIYISHRADKEIELGNTKKVEKLHLTGVLVFFVIFFISCFLAIYFGSTYVENINSSMPAWLSNGLKIAAGILPAIGMAMLLKMMNLKKYWPFLLLGFILAVYLQLNVLAVSLLGLSIAASIYLYSKKNSDNQFNIEKSDYSLDSRSIITKKELNSVFKRSFFNMSTINYERYMSLGFTYAMIPVLKKLYSGDEYTEALKRHNEFFNCHPYTASIVMGVSVAMEEQRYLGNNIDDQAITSTKAALMGPLSGIGDSVFKATFMTIFAAIGAGLALEGNYLGPIIFIIPNLILNIASRYFGVLWGYRFGVNLIAKIKSSDLLNNFVRGATIVGMMVVGAMIVSFVKFNFTLSWQSGGTEIVLQDLIDKIFPGLFPLAITLIFYKELVKNEKSIYWLMFTCFVIGIMGSFLGIM